jgi:hypothetical protein
MVGGRACGQLGDAHGRRPTMMASALLRYWYLPTLHLLYSAFPTLFNCYTLASPTLSSTTLIWLHLPTLLLL